MTLTYVNMTEKTKTNIGVGLVLTAFASAIAGFIMIAYHLPIYAIVIMFITSVALFITGIVVTPATKIQIKPVSSYSGPRTYYQSSFDDEEDEDEEWERLQEEWDEEDEEEEEERRRREEEEEEERQRQEEEDDWEEFHMYEDDD